MKLSKDKAFITAGIVMLSIAALLVVMTLTVFSLKPATGSDSEFGEAYGNSAKPVSDEDSSHIDRSFIEEDGDLVCNAIDSNVSFTFDARVNPDTKLYFEYLTYNYPVSAIAEIKAFSEGADYEAMTVYYLDAAREVCPGKLDRYIQMSDSTGYAVGSIYETATALNAEHEDMYGKSLDFTLNW